MVSDPYDQRAYDLRLDWGPAGASSLAADVAVVVDVLSFSTSVTVAVERGMTVYPSRWRGAQADALATRHDAVLALGRLEVDRSGGPATVPTLSPATLLTCDPVPRLVLPSPNGSTIAAALQDTGSEVVIGCLRNARAVAAHLAVALGQGRSVAIVAAGERWQGDDSLRPALEDHLGAGAILACVADLATARPSPEARAAADLFQAVRPRLAATLRDCVGGRELIGRGFGADVEVAADLAASTTVPVLSAGAFRPARPPAAAPASPSDR